MQKTYFRVMLAAAATYNFVFAAISGIFPEAFFQSLLAIDPPGNPWPWPYTAVLVGACGFLYAYAAWKPDHGDIAVGIGLLTKICGPAGWLLSVWIGAGSIKLWPLVLVGDLIWWAPLLHYLLRRRQRRE